MGGKLADAEVAEDEVQLAYEGEAAGPNVNCCLAPKLYWATCPAVLLLAVGKEACWQLHAEQGLTPAKHRRLHHARQCDT